MYEYNAKLHRVVDGDTVDLVVDLGFHTSLVERFRLADINTPELRRGVWCEGMDEQAIEAELAIGLKAKTRLEELLTDKQLVISTQKAKDKYGRYLVHIKTDAGMINAILVMEGLAKQS